jgi:hypothetical protein
MSQISSTRCLKIGRQVAAFQVISYTPRLTQRAVDNIIAFRNNIYADVTNITSWISSVPLQEHLGYGRDFMPSISLAILTSTSPFSMPK